MRLRAAYLWALIPAAFLVAAAAGQTPDRAASMAQITAWARSGHADAHSPSFTNWDAAGVIPPVCATCHAGAGFRALHGFDGSDPGMPVEPVATGGVVDCDTCHNPGLPRLTEIRLASGEMHPVVGYEGACMTCHQGRASTATIARAVADLGDDQVSADLSFVNPHYATAAASLLGSAGALGYQYPGKTYEPRFIHARPVSTCVSCHDGHSLAVAEETCLTCHQTADSRAIRISRVSHDGSGDLTKGIASDIAANRERLMGLIRDYARDVAGTPVVYDGGRHPYFFADHNADGLPDQGESGPVVYNAWTPRLIRAAYNWKFVGADAGIHVHNPHYALQLVHDSAEDLSRALGREFTGMAR